MTSTRIYGVKSRDNQPFVYVLYHVSTNRYYIGVRYGKNINHQDLLTETGYQTSSILVHNLIEKHGLDSFKIKSIRFFDSKETAVDYEYRFLKKIKAKLNPKIININCNKALDMNSEAYALRSKKIKEKNLIKKFGTTDRKEISDIIRPHVYNFCTIKYIIQITKIDKDFLRELFPEIWTKEYSHKSKTLSVNSTEAQSKYKKTMFKKRLAKTKLAKNKTSGEILGDISILDSRWKSGEIVHINWEPKIKSLKKCYTNGEDNLYLNCELDNIPNGFILGRTNPKESYKKIGITNKKKRWYTNGSKSIFINPDIGIPPNFTPGRGRLAPRGTPEDQS